MSKPSAKVSTSAITLLTISPWGFESIYFSGKISSFSNAFSKCSINIANMLNKSKKDLAYTIMDLDHEVSDEIVKELEGLENVLKVRVIR